MAEGVIDCMACLVSIARGLPEGGTHTENDITHATMRTQSGHAFLTCTVRQDPLTPGRVLVNHATEVPR